LRKIGKGLSLPGVADRRDNVDEAVGEETNGEDDRYRFESFELFARKHLFHITNIKSNDYPRLLTDEEQKQTRTAVLLYQSRDLKYGDDKGGEFWNKRKV
jgi:hypothetical protein